MFLCSITLCIGNEYIPITSTQSYKLVGHVLAMMYLERVFIVHSVDDQSFSAVWPKMPPRVAAVQCSVTDDGPQPSTTGPKHYATERIK